MALIRWEPARELHTIQQEMNRLFGTAFDAQATGAGGATVQAGGFLPWTSSRRTTTSS